MMYWAVRNTLCSALWSDAKQLPYQAVMHPVQIHLTGCIPPWYDNCLAFDHKALQRVVWIAQYITGAELPAIQDLYSRRCQRKALKMVKYSGYPSHRLFSLLPHGEQYRSVKSGTKKVPELLPPSRKTAEQPFFYALTLLHRLYAHSLDSTCTHYTDTPTHTQTHTHTCILIPHTQTPSHSSNILLLLCLFILIA